MSSSLVLRALGTAVGAGLAVIGWVGQPAASLVGVMLAVLVAGGVALRQQERPPADAAGGRRIMIAAGGTVLWWWLVATGVVVLLGPSVQSGLIAVLLIGVPAAFQLRRRSRPQAPAPVPAAALPAVVPSPVLRTLSTPELCLAWRRSYLTLVDLPNGPGRNELVGVRQSILDELERRDSEGFHRWLHAGARAGGDPGRYLATGA